MKKWIIRLAVLGFAILILVFVVLFLSLNIIVKKGIETVGPQIVKVDIKLGSASIRPFSGNGELSRLVVGNPPGYKSAAAIRVGDIKVNIAVGSLLSDTIKIESINIQAPEITCEGGLSGINLKEIQKNLASPAGKATTAPATSGKGEKKFYVKDIVIEGGKINVALNELGGKGMTVPLPPIHLQNIGSETMGVSANELVAQILEPILADAIKAAMGEAGNAGGKAVSEQINKITKGMKGLFK